jgi:hypothetical protein
MKKVNEYDKFLYEKFHAPKITKEKLQDIILKVKNIVPQEKINTFIETNKQDIENLADFLSDEEGNIDYGKVKEFMTQNLKRK